MIKKIKREIKDFGPSFKRLHFVEKVLASLFLFVVVITVVNIYYKTEKVEAGICETAKDCPVYGVVDGGHGTITSYAVHVPVIDPTQWRVELLVQPDHGYVLGGISSNCGAYMDGSYAVVTTFLHPCTVTVKFKEESPVVKTETWKVSVAANGTGSGTVGLEGSGIVGSCGVGCYNVTNNGLVTVTQKAAPGSVFDGMDVGCGGYNIPVDSNISCNVTFTKRWISVIANPERVSSGASSRISWKSSGYTFCTPPAGYESAGSGKAGDFWTNPLDKTTTFTISCR